MTYQDYNVHEHLHFVKIQDFEGSAFHSTT